MDLSKAISRFDPIVGSLGEVKLYTRGSSDAEQHLIDPSCWMTDKGLAVYFAPIRPGEELCESHVGPEPEECVTEDKRVIVTFAARSVSFGFINACSCFGGKEVMPSSGTHRDSGSSSRRSCTYAGAGTNRRERTSSSPKRC